MGTNCTDLIKHCECRFHIWLGRCWAYLKNYWTSVDLGRGIFNLLAPEPTENKMVFFNMLHSEHAVFHFKTHFRNYTSHHYKPQPAFQFSPKCDIFCFVLEIQPCSLLPQLHWSYPKSKGLEIEGSEASFEVPASLKLVWKIKALQIEISKLYCKTDSKSPLSFEEVTHNCRLWSLEGLRFTN